MRVLHVIDRFSRAGAETSLRELIAASGESIDHAICVLYPDGNEFPDSVHGGPTNFVPGRRPRTRLSSIRHVRSAIDEFEPDLVHTTLFDANTAGRVAARLQGVPVLTSLVNTPYVSEAMHDRDIRPWKHALVRRTDIVLSRHFTSSFHAITRAVADAYVTDFRLSPDRIAVVPRGRSRHRLGHPSAERRHRSRSKLGIDSEQRLILTLGRQEAQKGHRYLLEAAAAVLAEHPKSHIMVAGRAGAMTPTLLRHRSETGLEEAVDFLGFRRDIGDLLAAADVFVFPSLYEGLGGAVLEAMAMNVPIVASDIPALREVLEEGVAGVLVPPGQPAALAAALVDVLSDPETALEMAERARQRFENNYSAEASVEGMLALYEQLLRT